MLKLRGFIFLPLLPALFIFSFSIAPASASPDADLVIKNGNGEIVLAEKMKNGSAFAIRYIHSVALTPVTDYFVIKNNKIYLDKTVYKDFGAGLPSTPEKGQTMNVANGNVAISGYERELPRFDVRVGRIAQHTILLWPEGGKTDASPKEIPLSSLAAPGAALNFSLLQK